MCRLPVGCTPDKTLFFMPNNDSRIEASTEPVPETPAQVLTVEKLVYGGHGLARNEGRVYLMPKVAPGDVVEAHSSKSKSNFIQASVDRIITSAPNRVQPSCQSFEKC